jgi:hypothetical protein
VRLRVIAVTDVSGGDEQIERIIFPHVHRAALDPFLKLFHPLLPVAAEIQLLLVAPQYGGSRLDRGLGQHVVQQNDLIT